RSFLVPKSTPVVWRRTMVCLTRSNQSLLRRSKVLPHRIKNTPPTSSSKLCVEHWDRGLRVSYDVPRCSSRSSSKRKALAITWLVSSLIGQQRQPHRDGA